MILFDCEKLRSAFNGFYTYTFHLAEALLKESASRDEKLGLFLPGKLRHLFPGDTPVRRWHHVDKHFMWLAPSVKLFHGSTQLTRYRPRGWRLPVLVTVHDLNYMHLDFPEKTRESLRIRTESAIRDATHIAAISQYTKDDLLAHFDIPEEKITVIHNGIKPFTGTAKPPVELPKRPFILFLGRITASKNLRTLPALLCGNDYDLVLAGPRDKIDTETPAILERAAQFGVSDRIRFTGPLEESEKYWYLQHCEAFLFPSLAEGFGLPVLEALQFCKPVFCSQRSSIPEVGGDCVFYFNEQFDPEGMQQEFARGMEAFAAGAIPAEKIAERIARFSWEQAAQKYYDLYEQLI